tara:strand:- start:5773 stop:6798 length:1026 start_codon:yes stop_codon:yes gene_type:complete
MSTLKVDNIQSYAGGDVTLNGNLDVTGIISGDGSGLTNVPGGGGSDLSSYTGSINQTGGSTNLNGDFSINTGGGAQTLAFNGGGLSTVGGAITAGGGMTIPYDGSQQYINVNVSGSQNYNLGGFDFGGKAYGQIYSQATGGFKVVDGAVAGTDGLVLQSDNGNVNLVANNGSVNTNLGGFYGVTTTNGAIVLAASGGNIFRAQNANQKLTLTSGGFYTDPVAGGTSTFNFGAENTYGLNLWNASFTKDTGFCLDLNTASGQGRNKIGFFTNHGATYADVMSWEDASNFTDGALTVHQILKAEQGVQLPGLGDYVDDAAAATAGVPVSGVYRTGNVLKIRIV